MAGETLRAVPDSGEEETLLTIEQLAAWTGMTVRNIRSHRTAGLLPAPIVRDRVGLYGPEHLDRLRLVQELQGAGFNLRGIKRLIEETGGRPADLMALRRTLTIPFETEEPQVFGAEEVRARFGGLEDEPLRRAEALGMLVPLGDGRYEAPAPSLLEVAAEVVARGVPLEHTLSVAAKMRDHCQAIAREFVKLFLEDVWKPFAARGYPEEEWAAVLETIERLRPMSSQVVLSIYQLEMSTEVESAFGRELTRLSKGR